MKKLESNFVNMAVSLLLIAAAAAALLAWVHEVTRVPIEKINAQTLSDGIRSVIVGDRPVEFEVESQVGSDGYTFYRAVGRDGQLLGTAVRSETEGFGGTLTVLTGFDPDGNILGYEVLEHSETPGLGAQVNTWFKQLSGGDSDSQSALGMVILGKDEPAGNHNIVGMNPGRDDMTVSKDGGQVDAITASTITSRAFLLAVRNAYSAYMATNNK